MKTLARLLLLAALFAHGAFAQVPIYNKSPITAGGISTGDATNITGLILGNGTTAGAFGGTTCTNSFASALSASGVATCRSPTIGDAVTSGTAGRILYVGAGPVLADSAGLKFDGTSALTIGTANGTIYFGADGGQTLSRVAGDTYLDAYGSSSILYFRAGGTPTTKGSFSPVAGAGLSITAGTAVTDVAALSITQTWNNAAAATGVKIVITDTTSAAGALPLQILGGAAGATNLLSLSKTGVLGIGSTYLYSIVGGVLGVGATRGTPDGHMRLKGVDINQTVANNGMDLAYNTPGIFGLGAIAHIAWSASVQSAAKDTNISRGAAGLMLFGTGAAGSFAGRIKLTSAIVAGTTIANLNAAPTAGEIATITDQAAACPAKGVAPTAGGAIVCVVYYTGAIWAGI
jgi:hypothetical protein